MNQGATMRFSLVESDDSFAAGGFRQVPSAFSSDLRAHGICKKK